MPSESERQHNTMEMAEHDPAKAKKLGFNIPKKVAAEYVKADEGKKEDRPKKKYDEKAIKAQVEALRKPKEPEYVEDEC